MLNFIYLINTNIANDHVRLYSSNSHISLNYMYQSINNVPINQSNANLTFTVYVYPFYSRILPQYTRTSSGATVNHKLHFII